MADGAHLRQTLEAQDTRPGAAVEKPLEEGDVIGRLDIARLGLSVMILQGVEDVTLKVGAGHVPGTPLPVSRATSPSPRTGTRSSGRCATLFAAT